MASEPNLRHPNRDKPEAKRTRAAVTFLLLVGAILLTVITIGGWEKLEGAKPVDIFYILVFLLFAYYVFRWNRGVLPVSMALAVILIIFAAVAAPAWFARDKTGFDSPALEPSILGLLTVILIPVSVLLIAFALRGFQQAWNVEVEVTDDDQDYGGYEGQPNPA